MNSASLLKFAFILPFLFWGIAFIYGIYLLIKAKKLPRYTDEDKKAYDKKMKTVRIVFILSILNILVLLIQNR